MSERGKVFVVNCYGIKKDDVIILALYDGDRLLEVQYAPYDEDSITFTTQKVYESAKVMVWKGISDIEPICKYEKVYVY